MGYHMGPIRKGTLGEFSKITEEYDELKDALTQSNTVLALCELCDLIGAIEMYAKKFNVTLEELIRMKNATKSSFESGER